MGLKTLKREKPFEVPCPEGMHCTLDPLGAYEKQSPGPMWNSLGLLPYFVVTTNEDHNEGDTMEVAEAMLKVYGFGMSPEYNMLDTEGAQIDKDGVYSYPEDPYLAPIAKFDLKYTTIYIYPYALVGIDDGETQWMQRFD